MSLYKKIPKFSWSAKEVIKEIDKKPHLLIRIEISGSHFPHRALEPFMKIRVNKEEIMSSWFTDVSRDNSKLIGYFPIDLPSKGVIEFGYGNQVMGIVDEKIDFDVISHLDREQLPEKVVAVSVKYLKAKHSSE